MTPLPSRAAHRSEWIEPPTVLPDETIEGVRLTLQLLPSVHAAYIVGQRNTPLDGSPVWESVGIALVLEPSLPRARDEALAQLKKLNEKLFESDFACTTTWLFVSQEMIDERRNLVVPIYP